MGPAVDHVLGKQMLYQLSYSRSIGIIARAVVGEVNALARALLVDDDGRAGPEREHVLLRHEIGVVLEEELDGGVRGV